MLQVKLTLKDSVSSIEDKIINSLRLQLNSVFKAASVAIKRRIGDVCESLIKDTDEYHSLLSGQLLGELGVPDVDARLKGILKTIRDNIDVESTPIMRQGKQLVGGLVFKMIRSDYMDILGLPEATYNTEKGTSIPWLDWLLLQGDRIIVIGYDVKLNLTPREQANSRTGLALMKHGSGWRVPPQWSGTMGNNFITRAFDRNEVERLLFSIVEEEIVYRL